MDLCFWRAFSHYNLVETQKKIPTCNPHFEQKAKHKEIKTPDDFGN